MQEPRAQAAKVAKEEPLAQAATAAKEEPLAQAATAAMKEPLAHTSAITLPRAGMCLHHFPEILLERARIQRERREMAGIRTNKK
eukprot:scaffold92163_cov36-Phaeocystis_antarctica.AAC.1